MVLVSFAQECTGGFLGVLSELLANRDGLLLSHPFYSLNLAPANSHYLNYSCDESDDIRDFFIDPTDCVERTDGDVGGTVA
jgi:hypothetical protein